MQHMAKIRGGLPSHRVPVPASGPIRIAPVRRDLATI